MSRLLPLTILAFAMNVACAHATSPVKASAATARVLAKVGEPCGRGVGPEECLRSNRPAFDIRIDGSTPAWARLSRDGNLLIASFETYPEQGPEFSSVSAFDLRTRRELWRMRFKDFDPTPNDCFVLPSGVALAIPNDDGKAGGVVMLDAQTGAFKWQRRSTEGAWGVRVLGADEENDFLLMVDGRSVDLVDAATGKDLAAIDVSAGDETDLPRIYWTPTAAYVVTSGIARVARRERRLDWRQHFATYAYRPGVEGVKAGTWGLTDTGKVMLATTAALSIVSASLGGPWLVAWQARRATRGVQAVDADLRMGQTTAPIVVGGRVCIGNMGIISCFDEATGAFAWSRRFGVAQFRALAGGPGSFCAVAGGLYLHHQGTDFTVEQSKSGPLVCLDPRDGEESFRFAAPWGHSEPAVALTQTDLAAYDAQTAWKDAAHAGHAEQTSKEALPTAVARIQSGILVAQDYRVSSFGLPGGRMTSSTELIDIGPVQQLATTADTVVVSGQKGFAGFDRKSGAFLWKTSLAVAKLQPVRLANHDPQSLVRVSALAGREIDFSNGANVDAGMYWLLPELRILVAGESRGNLTALSLEDGGVLWHLEPHGDASIDGPTANPSLVVVADSSIRIYMVPSAGGSRLQEERTTLRPTLEQGRLPLEPLRLALESEWRDDHAELHRIE